MKNQADVQYAPLQSIESTSRITGASQFMIRKMCRDGSAPCIKSGSKYMVNVPLFMEVLDTMSKGGAGK